MTKRILAPVLALVTIGAALPPVASAAPFTPGLDRLYEVAIGWWGQEPTACATIDKQIVPDVTWRDRDAEATQVEPGEALASVACFVRVKRWMAKPAKVGAACKLMLHEVGHLLGYRHSADPQNIMSPVVHAMPSVCVHLTNVLHLTRRLHRLRVRARHVAAPA